MKEEEETRQSQEACDASLARCSAAAATGEWADGGGLHRPVHTAAAPAAKPSQRRCLASTAEPCSPQRRVPLK